MENFMDEFDEQEFQRDVDSLDVKYEDGVAYMNIHTIDIINKSLFNTLEQLADVEGPDGTPLAGPDLAKGAMWVMMVYMQIHDELDIRAETDTVVIPDTLEGLDG